MSSQNDVIELGSSDDEPEPKRRQPNKKLPQNSSTAKVKNTLNAMVHIPAGLSIKHSKGHTSKQSNKQNKVRSTPTPVNLKPGVKTFIPQYTPILPQSSSNKPLRVLDGTKISKINVNVGRTIPIAKNVTTVNQLKMKIPNMGINPLNLNPSQLKAAANKMSINSQSQKAITKLPASITVTKTKGQASNKRTAIAKPNVVIKKKKFDKPQTVETVELDDDDPLSLETQSRPQWYLNPEDTKETPKEQDYNEEPANSDFIEITIEDSPLKDKTKHLEVPITLDDSPHKQVLNHNKSDSETNNGKDTPKSKKKLSYSKPVENCEPSENADQENDEECSIEIELVPLQYNEDNNEIQNHTNISQSDDQHKLLNDKQKNNEVSRNSEQQEKINAPSRQLELDETKEAQKDNKINTNTDNPISTEKNISTNKDTEEFHPIYQQFIELCFQLENSEDMNKIIEKKVKAYYKQVPKDYTESEDFIDMVQTKMDLMKSSPKEMYLYIKDVVDQLNCQRKKEKNAQLSTVKLADDKADYGMVEVPDDSKRARQIRKLEKTLKKLHRAIQKLEEQEVDFDDDGDSVYILTERYKERVVRVHAKLCQLTNSKMPSLPRIEIECRPGQSAGPAKRLNKWLNRRMPPGTPSPFPDFHDVLRCVREANEQDKLGWNEADIMEEARDLFTRCGKKLQRRRQENEWRIAASRLTTFEDPAEVSTDLKRKLEENRKVAAQKEAELINKYADRQKQLKLEAEEITEKEAEESPAESEDDSAVISDDENDALENKAQRKQRLVRLIKEKTKHKSDKETGSDDATHSTKSSETIPTEDNKDSNKELETNEKEAEVTENIETDAKKTEECTKKSDDKENSDDARNENDLNSDIDELHLLQKLHSENEQHTSDESLISISDSLDSNSNSASLNSKHSSYSVVSIENSSSDSANDVLIDSASESNSNGRDDKFDNSPTPHKPREDKDDNNDLKEEALPRNNNAIDENSCMTINSESSCAQNTVDSQDMDQDPNQDDNAISKIFGTDTHSKNSIDIHDSNAMDVHDSSELTVQGSHVLDILDTNTNDVLENVEECISAYINEQNCSNAITSNMNENDDHTNNIKEANEGENITKECQNNVHEFEKNTDKCENNSNNNEIETNLHETTIVIEIEPIDKLNIEDNKNLLVENEL